jgi:hypothetical protein
MYVTHTHTHTHTHTPRARAHTHKYTHNTHSHNTHTHTKVKGTEADDNQKGMRRSAGIAGFWGTWRKVHATSSKVVFGPVAQE